MEEELYDDFGNYIGPALDQVEGEEDPMIEEMPREEIISLEEETSPMVSLTSSDPISSKNAIILHEDKQYYPSVPVILSNF
jgi:U5 small nuclear ribonucleoprotein component